MFDRWKFDEALASSAMSPKSRHVGMVLARRARRENGRCWPSVPLIAADTGLSERSVFRALDELKRKGFLTAYGRYGRDGRRSNVYLLRVRPLCPCCGQPVCVKNQVHDRLAGTPLTLCQGELTSNELSNS